jgi:prevent-host-death family protein
MSAMLNIHDAKTHFSKVLEQVAGGEDVVICRAGVPVAVVVSIDRYKPKREFGFARGAFQMSDLDAFNALMDAETMRNFAGEAD